MAGDDLRTGTWVTYVGGAPTGVRVRRCRLTVLAGPDAGLVRDVEAAVIRIGARRGNDVQLSDGQVSGMHCEIRIDERGYRLRDLDSTNGSWVGGLRVNDVYLPPAATLTVGGTKLRFDPLEQSALLELSSRDRFGGMLGTSVRMRELFARLERLAASDTTVLIGGETGVGKELVAESLHDLSPRARGPLVVVDCGAIPQHLIESELFGHERGAFTGAHATHAGAFERAHRGTIFLDEIGELPLAMQPRLLRVLERKEVRRVGGTKTIPVDIRVVAATNRDLGVEVNRGRFREDLFYRLAVARVHVPALRERREDLGLLIEHFLSLIPGAAGTRLQPETVDLMMRHDWPGNVRELRNVIERAVLLSESPIGDGGAASPRAAAVPASPPRAAPAATDEAPDRLVVAIDPDAPFKEAKAELVAAFEKRYVKSLLERHRGNISAAARVAGIDRMSIHKMLNRLGLHRPTRDDESGEAGGGDPE